MRALYPLLAIIFFVTGCNSGPRPELSDLAYGSYKEVDFTSLPSWEEERFELALEIFLKTCQRSAAMDLYKVSCLKAEEVFPHDREQAKAFFENNFTPFVSLFEDSLATGYYEPLLEGSLDKNESFMYPVYGVPEDLVRTVQIPGSKEGPGHLLRGRRVNGHVEPYFTRAQISTGALGPQRPICYVNDALALFFLHVQGSGCIRLQDGSVLHLGYGDFNGYPYVSIGKEMIKRGLIDEEKISLKSIVDYFEHHPGDRDEILSLNPSYVFFQTRKHSASGALGVVLDAERSVAVDRKYIPLGMPLYISTQDPLSQSRYEKMVFAHDTGSAIKGESRIDLFFGSGTEAETRAGKMKEKVSIWMLVPNDYLSKQEVK